jgi:hypothetical protein
MPGDPSICRQHAKRCWALAGETKNPVLIDSLVDLARRWAMLAHDIQFTRDLLEQWETDTSEPDPRQSFSFGP